MVENIANHSHNAPKMWQMVPCRHVGGRKVYLPSKELISLQLLSVIKLPFEEINLLFGLIYCWR